LRRPLSTVATLAAKASVSPTSYLFTLETAPGVPTARPGQFVTVAVSDGLTLRRPFAVAGLPSPGRYELLVEVRGPGTRALADKPVGARLEVAGPFGNTLTMPEDGETSILVAGGFGLAGLRLFAQELRRGYHAVHALVGARSATLLLSHTLPAPTADGSVLIEVATDDGSEGLHGPVTGLLKAAIERADGRARIYCCGPPVMIAAAARETSRAGVPCEALLEEMMACGVGACRGCVVKTRDGYRTVCKDGPVFDVEELVLEELVHA
jgi:dihydroorotate dehydrogenase electron transfer subunit